MNNQTDPLDKTCPQCGKGFHAKSKRQKYCSFDCSAIGTNKNQKRYQERLRERRAELQSREIECGRCGQKFTTSDTRVRFCSGECRVLFHKEKKAKAEATYRARAGMDGRLGTVTCADCGKKEDRRGTNQKYCKKCSERRQAAFRMGTHVMLGDLQMRYAYEGEYDDIR